MIAHRLDPCWSLHKEEGRTKPNSGHCTHLGHVIQSLTVFLREEGVVPLFVSRLPANQRAPFSSSSASLNRSDPPPPKALKAKHSRQGPKDQRHIHFTRQPSPRQSSLQTPPAINQSPATTANSTPELKPLPSTSSTLHAFSSATHPYLRKPGKSRLN